MLRTKSDILKALENKSSMLVLLYIHSHPDSTKTEVIEGTEGRNARTKLVRINDLLDAGLVEITSVEKHNRTHLRTTDVGAKISDAMTTILGEA